MKKICDRGYYFGNIEIEIRCSSGVLSVKADACIVPQYSTGISLDGPSGALIHSKAQGGIVAFQKFLREKKQFPFGTAYVTQCNCSHYRYLLHVPVLDCKDKRKIQAAIFDALKKAAQVGAKTVVIPNIDSNKNSLSPTEMAKVIFDAIDDFAARNSVEKVILAASSKEIFREYEKFFQSKK